MPTKTNDERFNEIESQLKEINGKVDLLESPNPLAGVWLPQRIVMRYFDYRDTQMANFSKQHGLVVSKIGNRKFFHVDSLRAVLEKNINQ